MTYRTLRRSAPFGRETISIVLCIHIVLEGCFSFTGRHEEDGRGEEEVYATALQGCSGGDPASLHVSPIRKFSSHDYLPSMGKLNTGSMHLLFLTYNSERRDG